MFCLCCDILAFLNPKLGTKEDFTMTKYSRCLYFGRRSCLNQLKSSFLPN